jgi:hypothetical protein
LKSTTKAIAGVPTTSLDVAATTTFSPPTRPCSDMMLDDLERTRLLLGRYQSASEVKEVIDIAVAAKIYAKRQRASKNIIKAAHALEIDALTRLGEILEALPKNTGTVGLVIGPGRGNKTGGIVLEPPFPQPSTLIKLGISKKESAEAQFLTRLKRDDQKMYEDVRSSVMRLSAAQRAVKAEDIRQTSGIIATRKPGASDGKLGEIFGEGCYPVVELPIADITVNKNVPNFKGDADPETGVVPGEELSGKYERLGTAPVVVWRRLTGNMEIVTGRHRLDLAKRTGEKTIPAQIVSEKDGFTKERAITFDAESNIRDGNGTVGDYAHYFNNTHFREAEAQERGLLARVKGKTGWSLAKAATDDVYALWRDGKLSDLQAVAIATAAPGDAAAKGIGSKFGLQDKSPDFLSNIIKASKAEAGQRGQNLDLFGGDDSAMKQMEERAERASQLQRDIRQRIQVLQAGKKAEIAKSEGIDVKNPEAIPSRIKELKGELGRWENWPMHSDLMAKITGGTRV